MYFTLVSGCHMTCHWICRGLIRVYCQGSSDNVDLLEEKVAVDSDKVPLPAVDSEDVEDKERKNHFSTLSTIESVDVQTLDAHSASATDLCVTQFDASSALDSSELVSSTILADQVAHISLVKKREALRLAEPRDSKARAETRNDYGTVYFTASGDLKAQIPDNISQTSTTNTRNLNADNPNDSFPFYTPQNSPTKPNLVRHDTDLGQRRRPKKTNLTSRHSFLAGQGSDASIYSRLSYDFSSLDKEAIRTHGIHVRQLNPCTSTPNKPPGLTVNSKHPPIPPQRKSSLIRPKDNSSSTALKTSPGHTELGLASVIQSTEAFIKSKPKYGKRSPISPVSPVPLTSVVVGPRGRLPYTVNELDERVSSFNKNEFGLQALVASGLPDGDCEGQVRIHINLLRPIRMLLRPRPASIFDIVGKENEADEEIRDFSWCPPIGNAKSNAPSVNGPKSAVTNNAASFSTDSDVLLWHKFDGKGNQANNRTKSSMFWVPRGSTKVLHVRLSTTAQKVISTLLDRFQIEDNPQKFALYEHTIEGDQEVSVRKLFDDESPLGLLFRWTENGPGQFNHLLGVKRLVLQENETGDIEWSGFSLPELTVFLGILNQEEADYRRRIEMKFEVRRKELLRLMALCEREETEVIEGSVSTEPTAFVRELSDDEMEVTSGPSDSLSTPASPLLQSRKAINPTEPESPSSPIAPSHTVGPSAASTLPRFFGMDDRLKSTLFKPSQYKRLKKADRAQQKLLAKTERDRIKAEKKKKKSESKQAQQNPGTQTHGRKWLTGFSAAFSPSVAASSSDNRSAPSS
ncbi:Rassf1 [Fasciola gigantica]|uniref:Rassf1 n=1 Tax=Fasciola gigantica TaxID=46835 RepID=A0A504YL93_FASGI|nr:Rassf1 [Fasciola gigantica]